MKLFKHSSCALLLLTLLSFSTSSAWAERKIEVKKLDTLATEGGVAFAALAPNSLDDIYVTSTNGKVIHYKIENRRKSWLGAEQERYLNKKGEENFKNSRGFILTDKGLSVCQSKGSQKDGETLISVINAGDRPKFGATVSVNSAAGSRFFQSGTSSHMYKTEQDKPNDMYFYASETINNYERGSSIVSVVGDFEKRMTAVSAAGPHNGAWQVAFDSRYRWVYFTAVKEPNGSGQNKAQAIGRIKVDKDGKFIRTDGSKDSVDGFWEHIKDDFAEKSQIKGIVIDNEQRLMFVGDFGLGKIYIFDLKGEKPELAQTIDNVDAPDGLWISNGRLLSTSYKENGKITIYKITDLVEEEHKEQLALKQAAVELEDAQKKEKEEKERAQKVADERKALEEKRIAAQKEEEDKKKALLDAQQTKEDAQKLMKLELEYKASQKEALEAANKEAKSREQENSAQYKTSHAIVRQRELELQLINTKIQNLEQKLASVGLKNEEKKDLEVARDEKVKKEQELAKQKTESLQKEKDLATARKNALEVDLKEEENKQAARNKEKMKLLESISEAETKFTEVKSNKKEDDIVQLRGSIDRQKLHLNGLEKEISEATLKAATIKLDLEKAEYYVACADYAIIALVYRSVQESYMEALASYDKVYSEFLLKKKNGDADLDLENKVKEAHKKRDDKQHQYDEVSHFLELAFILVQKEQQDIDKASLYLTQLESNAVHGEKEVFENRKKVLKERMSVLKQKIEAADETTKKGNEHKADVEEFFHVLGLLKDMAKLYDDTDKFYIRKDTENLLESSNLENSKKIMASLEERLNTKMISTLQESIENEKVDLEGHFAYLMEKDSADPEINNVKEKALTRLHSLMTKLDEAKALKSNATEKVAEIKVAETVTPTAAKKLEESAAANVIESNAKDLDIDDVQEFIEERSPYSSEITKINEEIRKKLKQKQK